MYVKNTFFEILHSLTTKEFRHFMEFLQSPMVNKNEKYIRLLKYLKPFHPNYLHKKLTKETIFKAVYGKTPYHDQTFRLLMSESTRLLQKCMVYHQVLQDEFQQKIYWSDFLQRKSNIEDLIEFLEKKSMLSTNFIHENTYKENMIWNEKKYHYITQHAPRNQEGNLQSLIQALDGYYVLKKLKVYCEGLNRKNIVSVEYQDPLSEILFSQLPLIQTLFKANTLIIVYTYILQMLQTNDEEYFNKTYAYTQQNISTIHPSELKDIFSFLQNYCIKQSNAGNLEYLKTLFSIYKILLQKEIIVEDGQIPMYDFKNIATVALRLGEFSFVQEFTETYKNGLPEAFKQSAVAYNMARLFFYQKKYREALKYLQHVSYADVYYELGCRSLLLKIYYEQEDALFFDHSITSFKNYLLREKQISPQQLSIYKNFVSTIALLFDIKMGNTQKIATLEKRLSLYKNMADYSWILEKKAEILEE